MAAASRHRHTKAKNLLEKIGMGHAIPYLIPSANHFMASGEKTLFTIQGVTDLPQELDIMVLMPLLTPNFLPPEQQIPLQRGEIPSFVSIRKRRTHLMNVFRGLRKTFEKLLLVSKAFRRLLLDPYFRVSLYYQWYRSPIEGLDGRPDLSLSHNVRMEIPRVEVPGLIDPEDGSPLRLNARWYFLFLRTVAFNYDTRYKYLTTYRAQRLVTLGLVHLGGNTPQLIQVGPLWRSSLEKRSIAKGRYIEHKPDMARTVSTLLKAAVQGFPNPNIANGRLYEPDARKFLEQNGMLSPNMIARITNISDVSRMTSPYLERWWRKTTTVAYEKYVKAGEQIIAYHDGNKMSRALEIEVLRVPTVMRPQAFFASTGHNIKKIIGFERWNDQTIMFGVAFGHDSLHGPPYSLDPDSVPETVLIWDKPVFLDLKINKENMAYLPEKQKRHLKPTVFNIGTIQIGEMMNVDFMRLANPNRTREVLMKLTSHLNYPEADEHFKHPKIDITWGYVTMGSRYKRPFHIREELDQLLKIEKLKENLPLNAAFVNYQLNFSGLVRVTPPRLPEGQQRVFRAAERSKL